MLIEQEKQNPKNNEEISCNESRNSDNIGNAKLFVFLQIVRRAAKSILKACDKLLDDLKSK